VVQKALPPRILGISRLRDSQIVRNSLISWTGLSGEGTAPVLNVGSTPSNPAFAIAGKSKCICSQFAQDEENPFLIDVNFKKPPVTFKILDLFFALFLRIL
jgi:hypothetical protein